MPRRVAEVFIQFSSPQHASCRLVYISCSHSRCHGGNRSLLRFQHRIIHVPLTGQRLAHVYGTGHITAISVENNTEVQCQEPTLRQLGRCSPTMWQRRPFATCNDRIERHSLCPCKPRRIFQSGGHLRLLQPRFEISQPPFEQLATHIRARPHPSNLLHVLHLAHKGDQRSHRNKHSPTHL